jgi:choline-sulfatase
MPEAREPLRPVGEVLGASVLAGLIAGLAAGAIDALWSWGPAAQFAPGIATRLRFVTFVAITYAAAGAAIGLMLGLAGLSLSRGSRLGDLLRFGVADHTARRAQDPGSTVAGLAFTLSSLPLAGMALGLVYTLATPYVTGRKALGLVVIVVMVATIAALVLAVLLAFPIARALEGALAPLARKWRPLSSIWAVPIAAGALLAIACAAWAAYAWETARVLPLRGPVMLGVGLALSIAAWRPGLALAIRMRSLPKRPRIALAAGAPVALIALVLALGGSASVYKATSAYTGLGGPIARTLRKGFDWDRDGYSRILGGGDCDDGDPAIHPGAPEIPGDGIDQNCVGGDETVAGPLEDPSFAPIPASVPADFRVLMITIDTVRADHFGMYGYHRPTSPNLDALGKDGTVFEHGWAHAPSTRYSIPAILTGRLPLDVRYDTSHEGWPGLSTKAHTIGEALAERGFHGGAITNYWYFAQTRRMDQGLAEYDNANASRHSGSDPAQTKGSSSKEQTDKAIAFVDRNAEKRWFLWVHYYDPHYKFEKHAEVPDFGNDEQALYDNEIRFTDLHVGRLIDHLKSTGLYDKTVIVVTGDHGEGFGEHGVQFHGYHLYAAQTKVPMLVRVPGIAPRRSTTPMGHIDILPTLVNLAGGKPDSEMMGRSMVDAIAGSDRDRVIYQQLSFENNNEKRGGADRQCHVIYNVSPDTSWEVYRVDRDPAESEDLAASDECAATRTAVERWHDRPPPEAAAALLPSRPAITAPLDATIGPSVKLLECAAPKTVKPGESIDLQWTWEVLDTVDPGWKVFAHVEGPSNKLVVNGDHAPVRPFAWWQAGQFIRYTTTITLPRHAARGRYSIRTGLFKGNQRAEITASAKIDNNSIVCATFEVAP